MKKLFLMTLLWSSLLSATLASDSWIVWRPLNQGFSILLPATPKDPPPGPNQWQAFDEMRRLYGVVVQPSTPGLEPSKEQLEQVMDSVAQQSNGTVKDKRHFKFKEFQAFECKVVTLSNQTAATRIVVTPHKRYVLSFVSSTRNFDEATMKKFFDSLQIIPLPTSK